MLSWVSDTLKHSFQVQKIMWWVKDDSSILYRNWLELKFSLASSSYPSASLRSGIYQSDFCYQLWHKCTSTHHQGEREYPIVHWFTLPLWPTSLWLLLLILRQVLVCHPFVFPVCHNLHRLICLQLIDCVPSLPLLGFHFAISTVFSKTISPIISSIFRLSLQPCREAWWIHY